MCIVDILRPPILAGPRVMRHFSQDPSFLDMPHSSQSCRIWVMIADVCSETSRAVHNLRDLRLFLSSSTPLPYTVSFDEALKTAVEDDPACREESMAGLLRRPDARKAHPTFEHLMPIYVGAGAAGADSGKRLWTLKEGSMSWAQYRFGEV